MSWLGRSLGEFGSELGEARDIRMDWRAREAATRIAQARQRLEELMAPLRIQQLREEIRQAALPQFEGVEKLPGGGLGVLERAPDTGVTGMRTLTPGLSRDSARKQIGNWATSVPAAHRGYFDALTSSLDDPSTDPLKAVEDAEKYAARISESGVGKGTAKVLFRGQIPFGISDPASGVDYYADEQHRLHAPDGGPAPFELQQLYTSSYKSYQQGLQDQYDMLAKRGQQAEARQLRQFQNQREMAARKAGQDAVDAQNRLLDSEAMAKNPTNAGDMTIVENFMQLSFGRNPRAVRGSPVWYDTVQRVAGGSLGERLLGKIESLVGGGLLGDDARKQLLANIRMLAKNRITAAASQAESYVPHFGVPALPGVDLEEPGTTPGGPPPPPVPGAVVTEKP